MLRFNPAWEVGVEMGDKEEEWGVRIAAFGSAKWSSAADCGHGTMAWEELGEEVGKEREKTMDMKCGRVKYEMQTWYKGSSQRQSEEKGNCRTLMRYQLQCLRISLVLEII